MYCRADEGDEEVGGGRSGDGNGGKRVTAEQDGVAGLHMEATTTITPR